jgi:transcriptional regulator with XRE-family HTH domain
MLDDKKATNIHQEPRPKNQRHDPVKRAEMGMLIKSLRVAAGLTQHDLAQLTGQKYVSFISQIEQGRVRVPSADILMYANILGVDTHAFAKECVRHYELENYFNAIYSKEQRQRDLHLPEQSV